MLLNARQTRKLYSHAIDNRYAILAVNADSSAAISDCLLAAKHCDAPIIIETSLWQLTGHGFGMGEPLLGIDRYLAEIRALADSKRFQGVPIVYHTDHIKGDQTEAILKHAIRAGASSISLDSSDMCAKENITTMRNLCEFALENNLPATMEMEAGVDDGVTELAETRTLFGEVERQYPGYLALWAPGVGTQHGLHKDMDGFSPNAVRKHQELASDLANRAIGIALHGSSGLTDKQLAAAVAAGVAKVNWSSESLLIRSAGARHFYADSAAQLERSHPDWKNTAMDNGVQSAVSETYVPRVCERIRTLGGDGRARAFNAILS